MSCTNHGCILRDDTHKGMGTNSICQCARRDPIGTERRVHELLKERESLRSQLAAVTAERDAAKACYESCVMDFNRLDDERTALRAELAAATAERQAQFDARIAAVGNASYLSGELDRYVAHVKSLENELAAARDDAERWRRARRHGVLKLGTPVSTEFVYNDEADAYMDAARSAEQQGENG